MSESRAILENVINDFSPDKFTLFFRKKSRNFVAREDSYSRYNDDDFKNGIQLGEIKYQENERLLICAFEVKKPLSERAKNLNTTKLKLYSNRLKTKNAMLAFLFSTMQMAISVFH